MAVVVAVVRTILVVTVSGWIATTAAASIDAGERSEPDGIIRGGGVSGGVHRTLIVGGEPARKEDDDYGFFVHFEGERPCGGSLIAPMVVLTAGHCWTETMKEAVIGPAYHRERPEEEEEDGAASSERRRRRRMIGRVAEVRIHPDYNVAGDLGSDFLLVRLSSIDHAVVVESDEPPRRDHGVFGAWRDPDDDDDDGYSDVPSGPDDRRHRRRRLRNHGDETDEDSVENAEGHRAAAAEEEDEEDHLLYVRLNSDPTVPLDDSPLTVIGMGHAGAFEGAKTLQHIRPSSSSSMTASASLSNGPDDAAAAAAEPFRKIPTSVCNGPGSYDGMIDKRTMFCAGTMEGGKDACKGDSGGPLFYYDDPNDAGASGAGGGGGDGTDTGGGGSKGRPVQVGVVSWGGGCGLPMLPGVYASVSSAHRWIREVVCGDWKSAISTGDDRDDDDDDDWSLCRDYGDRSDRDRIGGIFRYGEYVGGDLAAAAGPGCDPATEASLDFRLTADAYGQDTSWELLSNRDDGDAIGPHRVAGDQLFNDHETRLYRFCLPRDERGDGTGADAIPGDADDDDGGENPDIDDIEDGRVENSEGTGGSRSGGGGSNDAPIDRGDCFTLNVRDRMADGMVYHETTHGHNDDDDDEATATTTTSADPAGFSIRFGTAEAYEGFDFFPDFGAVATFLLCPAAAAMDSYDTDGGREDEDVVREEEDAVYAVTEAPTHRPSRASSHDQPTAFPTSAWIPLGDLIRMDSSKTIAQRAELVASALRGRADDGDGDGDGVGSKGAGERTRKGRGIRRRRPGEDR